MQRTAENDFPLFWVTPDGQRWLAPTTPTDVVDYRLGVATLRQLFDYSDFGGSDEDF